MMNVSKDGTNTDNTTLMNIMNSIEISPATKSTEVEAQTKALSKTSNREWLRQITTQERDANFETQNQKRKMMDIQKSCGLASDLLIKDQSQLSTLTKHSKRDISY